MLIWKGKQEAGAGTYWDVSTGERITIQGQDTLPGDESTTYIKASGTMMLLLSPVLGLTFAIFLPFIGIAMAISFVGKKIVNAGKRRFKDMAASTAKNVFFAWRPLQAYLTNKRRGGKREKNNGRTKRT